MDKQTLLQIIKEEIEKEIGYEFPEFKETSEIDDIGFFEGLIPNVKLMMVRDDNTKAEVMKRSFGENRKLTALPEQKKKMD